MAVVGLHLLFGLFLILSIVNCIKLLRVTLDIETLDPLLDFDLLHSFLLLLRIMYAVIYILSHVELARILQSYHVLVLNEDHTAIIVESTLERYTVDFRRFLSGFVGVEDSLAKHFGVVAAGPLLFQLFIGVFLHGHGDLVAREFAGEVFKLVLKHRFSLESRALKGHIAQVVAVRIYFDV